MNTFSIPDKAYDFIKKLVTVVLPATTVLLVSLGSIWGWDVQAIVQTTGAIALFLGAVVGIANVPFQKAGGGAAGDIQVVSMDDGSGGKTETTLVSFNQDPGTLKDGQRISLVYKDKPVDISDL